MKECRRNFEFRAGTCDANVFHDVVIGNEYRLPETLAANEWIVDVGCHIGSFTQACLERGARQILAFEPDTTNYHRARKHLRGAIGAGWVTLLPTALSGFHSGIRRMGGYLVSGEEVNTGGRTFHDVVGARTGEWVLQMRWADLPNALRDGVHWMKLDCEGSEWEILRALRPFAPRNVFGEYHPLGEKTQADLQPLLESVGYGDVVIQPHGETGLGLFWAKQQQ